VKRREKGKVGVRKCPREIQKEILDKFVAYSDNANEPMFQKVWKAQKVFVKIYVPYMRLQQADAEVKLK